MLYWRTMKVSVTTKVFGFFKQYKPQYYRKGETIIRAHDEPTGVNYIVRGYVKLYSISPEGQEFTLNIFRPGSYFPIMWALGGENNHYYYEAVTPTEIRRAPKKEVLNFINENPGVLLELTKRLISGLEGILIRMEHLILGDAKQKVSSTVFLLAKRFGEKNGKGKITIRLPITHQGIANLAGISRETTSLEMKRLEREGTISKQGRLIIVQRIGKLRPKVVYFSRRRTSKLFLG